MLAIFRSDLRLLESYLGVVRQPVQAPIRALYGTDDAEVPAALMVEWQSSTRAEFRLDPVEGDHYFVETRREQLVKLLTEPMLPTWHSRCAGLIPGSV
jgi:surfactin synthase thioesterase subunit